MSSKENERGFGLVGILFLFLILGLLTFVGWRFYTRPHSSKSESTTVPSKELIATQDNKVSLSLPADWSAFNRKDNPDSCGFPGADTNILGSCILSVGVAPTVIKDVNNVRWSIKIYKTNADPKVWAELPLGLPSADFAEQSTQSINGYTSYYVKVSNDSYTDLNYLISHDGYLVYLYERESDKHYSPDGKLDKETDLSGYTPAFKEIVNSLTIK